MELSHIIPILSLHCPHNFTIVFPMWSPSSSHTIYSNGSNACIHDAPRHLLEELHQSQQQGNMITCPIQRGIWHIFLGEILGISYWNGGIRHFFWICFLGRLGIGTWNRKLVGGFKHFYFPCHIWDVILPIDFHIFQDGYCTTKQSYTVSLFYGPYPDEKQPFELLLGKIGYWNMKQ